MRGFIRNYYIGSEYFRFYLCFFQPQVGFEPPPFYQTWSLHWYCIVLYFIATKYYSGATLEGCSDEITSFININSQRNY